MSGTESRLRRTLKAALLPGFAVVLVGCSAVRAKPVPLERHAAARRASVLDGGSLSAATRESLGAIGVSAETCRDLARRCLDRLLRSDGLDDERRLSAAAELWLAAALPRPATRNGARAERPDPDARLQSLLEAARAGYAYLFFTRRTASERAFEDRQAQVRDFYEFAVESVTLGVFERTRGAGHHDDDPDARVEVGAWTIRRGTVDVRLPLDRPLREVLPAARLDFRGIRDSYGRDGFGAPFVAIAAPEADERERSAPPWREPGYVAASVVIEFPGTTLGEVLATHEAIVGALDSSRHDRLRIGGTDVPLAANFTAPYAVWLERSRFAETARTALLTRAEALVAPRVYLTQPFDPERRTVILIHGLGSSPVAWADLANELTGDELVRQGFQIWQLFYRTSAPLAYSVHAVRGALEATLDHFDPQRTSRASREMVLVGHSMGGVIARLLVLDSGDALWRAVFGHAPSPLERSRYADVAPIFELTPMPEVTRAVFLASPHRGAPRADSWLGRLGRRLVLLPASLMEQWARWADELDSAAPARAAELRAGLDGLDSLDPDHPFIVTTAALAVAPGVTLHSIIGCARPTAELTSCDDGWVPYDSAHLDGVASELVVESGHSVQQTPRAIVELRRILRLHLAVD